MTSLVRLVDEYLTNRAPVENIGPGNVELFVLLLPDLAQVVWVGESFSRDDFLLDPYFEIPCALHLGSRFPT